MQKTFKKIWSIVSTVIVVLVVLIAVFLMGSRLLGYQVYNVLSGSMSPAYEVGDLLYVKEVSPEEIKVGDVITFVRNESLVVVTHRVVEINYEEQYFVTKGDVNSEPDQNSVHFNNLLGRPDFSIPKLGYVSDFIQHPPGTYISLGIALLLILLAFIPDIIIKIRDLSRKNRQTEGLQSNNSQNEGLQNNNNQDSKQ